MIFFSPKYCYNDVFFTKMSGTRSSAPSAGGGTTVGGGNSSLAKNHSRDTGKNITTSYAYVFDENHEPTPAPAQCQDQALVLGESQSKAPALGESQNQASVLSANRSLKPMLKSLNFGQRILHLFSDRVYDWSEVEKYNSDIISHVRSQDIIIRDCETTISQLREDNDTLNQTCQDLQLELENSLKTQAKLETCEIELQVIKPKFESLLEERREKIKQIDLIRQMMSSTDKDTREKGLRQFNCLKFKENLDVSTGSPFSKTSVDQSAASTPPSRKDTSFEDPLADSK